MAITGNTIVERSCLIIAVEKTAQKYTMPSKMIAQVSRIVLVVLDIVWSNHTFIFVWKKYFDSRLSLQASRREGTIV